MEYAIKADFKYFGWKWTESRSPSRSPSRFDVSAVGLTKLAALQPQFLDAFRSPCRSPSVVKSDESN